MAKKNENLQKKNENLQKKKMKNSKRFDGMVKWCANAIGLQMLLVQMLLVQMLLVQNLQKNRWIILKGLMAWLNGVQMLLVPNAIGAKCYWCKTIIDNTFDFYLIMEFGW